MLTECLNESLIVVAIVFAVVFLLVGFIAWCIDFISEDEVTPAPKENPKVIEDAFADRLVITVGEDNYHFDIPKNMGYYGFINMLNESVVGPVVEDMAGPIYGDTGIAVITFGEVATGMMGEAAARRIFGFQNNAL